MFWWAGAAVIIVIAAAAFWWWFPLWQANRLRLQIHDAKDLADVEDNFRKTIGQLLGGAAVLIGAGFAYYQSLQAQQATHDQLKATYDQIEASKAQLISQQVSKGFEQLGDKENVVIRLGGIYALEGVMNTSSQYQEAVLEALCAFVRDGTKAKMDDNVRAKSGSPAADIQAALTVIGRRADRDGVVDLNRADLTGARLIGAELSGADLTGADLTNADMRGAHLSNADLTGANLNGASLNGAHLDGADLTGADLRGARLTGANLFDPDLPSTDLLLSGFADTDLTNADLRGADLTGAKVAQAPLDKACGDRNTKLPSGLTLKPCRR